MKLPAVLSRIFTRQKAFVPPLGYGQGWPVIREPFAGAWQSHVTVDSPRDLTAFSAVFACITKIAGDVAKMRMMLVEEEDGICSEVESSPYRIPLDTPNDYQNRIKFFQQWVVSRLLYGNAYALKERDDRKMVRRLHLLDASRVTVLVTENGEVYYRLAADNLAGVPVMVTVPASEIIHDRMVSLWNPLVGVSPIYACGLSATMGNRIQKNSTGFFQNMSRPGGALIAPGKLDAQDAANLKREWEANFGGENAGRTAVLGNGLKYENLGAIAAEQAQLVEQLDWTVGDVARCFHVPLYKIGGPIPANTSVEALDQSYYSECIQVHAEDIEISLKDGLSLPPKYYAEFDLDGLLRMDSAALHESLAKAVGAGYMAPNEARRRVNLKPVTGGNTPYLQQQNYSLSALDKRDTQADPFGKEKPAETPPAPAANAEEYAAAMSACVEKAVSEALASERAEREAKEAEELHQVQVLADFVIRELHAA